MQLRSKRPAGWNDQDQEEVFVNDQDVTEYVHSGT